MTFARKVASIPKKLHARIHRMSLRARLLVGLVAVAIAGLVVADIIVYDQISGYLGSQVDQELATGINQIPDRGLSIVGTQIGPIGQRPLTFGPPGSFIEIVSASGGFIASSATTASGDPLRLGVPASIRAALASTEALPGPSLLFSTSASNGVAYRAEAFPVNVSSAFSSGGAIGVVAIPLSGVVASLHRLIFVDILASLFALALLVLLGYVVVRVGMRPLGEIEHTAEEIASGDLSSRVEIADARTEVGRLGAALNVMLGRIEHAFSERQASEARLRRFLSDASHELRTPVTSIRGYSELFRRGAASRPEDLATAMRRIEDEAARMGVLVDDLLLLARLDEGRPLSRDGVDLVAIAADAVSDAAAAAPGRSLSLVAPAPLSVVGDEMRLRQVLANLLQNALRYTPDDSPIEVAVYRRDDHAVLSVRDEGPGLSAEHAARIFERFYRGDPSRARGSGGSGLGLAIVASITEAHGGRASVETAPGQGATFIIELPITPPPAADPFPEAGLDDVGLDRSTIVAPSERSDAMTERS